MKNEIREGYTRVTEVFSQWDWLRFAHIPEGKVEAAGYRGTLVHEAIDSHLKGFPAVLNEEEGGMYYQSFLQWEAKENLQVYQGTTRLYNDDLMITGEFDALIKTQDGLVVIDWKTSYNEDKLFWPWQGCMYRYLLECSGMEDLSDKIWFVKLDSKGELPKIHEYSYDLELVDDYKCALRSYRRVLPHLKKLKQGVENGEDNG